MSNITYLHTPVVSRVPLPRRKWDWSVIALIAANFVLFGLALIGLVSTLKSITH